jgi:hypothetical protein
MDRAQDIEAGVDTNASVEPRDRGFALARGFSRVDGDPRSISAIPEATLLLDFGDR